MDDISDSLIVGRSEEHISCWKCLQTDSYDSALEYAQQIIEREPQKTDGYVFKSRALYKMGRFRESEETLLEVMKIAEQNDLILTDIEAFIKLKYELASIRKEILKSLDVINVKDVLKRHLNDLETPIIDLHLFSGSSKSSTPKKCSVVESDLIKSEVNDSEVLEVKPILRDCDSQNSDSYQTYNSSEEYDSCRTPLFSNDFGPEDIDERVVTISLKEYLRLKESDKKCLELEQKVHNLEEELKQLYFSTLNVAIAKKKTDREVNTLRSELDRISNTIKYVEDREEEDINRKYYGIHASKPLKKTSKIVDKPKMISIKKIDIKPIDVKKEPPNTQTSIRNIYHNNKGVPKVDL